MRKWKAGKIIVKKAIDWGIDVTVIVRSENKNAASKTIYKDLFDLTYEDVREFDVIIDCFGA